MTKTSKNGVERKGAHPPAALPLSRTLEGRAADKQGSARIGGRIDVETVRFDLQALETPDIEGVEYPRGARFGKELWPYRSEKWGGRCAYGGAAGVRREAEPILCKGPGGTDPLGNRTAPCRRCNRAKNNRRVERFLAQDLTRLENILAQARGPSKVAAAVTSKAGAPPDALKGMGVRAKKVDETLERPPQTG